MGKDKGSLLQDGKLWVEVLRDKVSSFSDVLLSVGSHNLSHYENVSGVKLILDQPLENIAGPLKGLLSANEELAKYDKVLVVPCDMVDLKAEYLQTLVRAEKSCVYEVNGRIEPLPFCLGTNDVLSLDKLENRSLKAVLKSLNCQLLKIEVEEGFKNYNSPSDF